VAIRCRRLVYVYPDGTRATDGIDLTLRRGELFCLLGPNGAGKTTLIRQVTTELVPTAGCVVILGMDAHRDPAATKRRLGVIPQMAGLFEALTVRDHIELFGPLKHLTARQSRVAAQTLLDELELTALARKRVRELSGGARRKIFIALALLGDPEILVLDEPTVGLDPIARRAIWALVKEQQRRGKTILLTTHYMDEAEHLADRIGFLSGGRLGQVGTLPELYARLGKSVRVDQMGNGHEPSYFDTLEEAQRFVRDRGWAAYSVGRVSLEDIFLRLMGTRLTEERAA
jgi:ABC-2 type transport system ATP-binding protein